MYTLHIGNKNYSSWSLRPWVLMRAVGIPFEEQLHRFPEDGSSSYAEFKTFSPSGYVPVLADGDSGDIAWDSLGIVGYLAERHAAVWPAAPKERSWARCAAAEMHSGFMTLRNNCGMNVGLRCRRPAITPALQRDLDRLDELFAEGLDRFGGPFLAGRAFTAVDAFFCPVAYRALSYDLPLSRRSLDYLARLRALPAMQDWERAALAETFREPNHDAGTAGSHDVIEDLRAK